MDTTPTRPVPGDLPAVWRQRAQFLSDFGDPTTARLWLLAADELERALEAVGAETLSLTEAAVHRRASDDLEHRPMTCDRPLSR